MSEFFQLDLRRNDSTVWFGDGVFGDQFGNLISLEQMCKLCKGKRVCVLFHGFNVEEPMGPYARFVLALQGRYDAFIGVRWPGSQIKLAFWLACMRANKAGKRVAKILMKILADAAHVTLMGHSLGCRVLLQAVKAGLHCTLAVLAAAAVDDECLEPDEEFGCVPDRVKRAFVAFSQHDSVLAGAYRFAKLDNALGRVGPQRPELMPGNVACKDLSEEIKGHSDYVKSEEFVKWWRLLAA